jgi:Putative phage serine protease XkdF
VKTYQAIYNPKTNKGVYGISLVEAPAMEGVFIALSKEEKLQFKTINSEQRIIVGLVLEPNKPIYRNQEGEEFNIFFDENTVKELSHGFFRNSFQNNSTIEHSTAIDGVTIVESWIVEDEKQDKSTFLGLSYPKGSWMATMKIDNEDIWNDFIKTGKVKGFSIDAMVSLEEVNLSKHTKMEKSILEQVKEGFAEIKTLFSKKVELGKVSSADGSVIMEFEGETMTVGGDIWVVDTDGNRVAVPVGDYELEDKTILVVSEDGKIGEVKQAEPVEDSNASAPLAEQTTGAGEIVDAIKNQMKSIMIKYAEENNNRFEKLEKLFLELSKQPASSPIKATPTQINFSEMTNFEKLKYNREK